MFLSSFFPAFPVCADIHFHLFIVYAPRRCAWQASPPKRWFKKRSLFAMFKPQNQPNASDFPRTCQFRGVQTQDALRCKICLGQNINSWKNSLAHGRRLCSDCSIALRASLFSEETHSKKSCYQLLSSFQSEMVLHAVAGGRVRCGNVEVRVGVGVCVHMVRAKCACANHHRISLVSSGSVHTIPSSSFVSTHWQPRRDRSVRPNAKSNMSSSSSSISGSLFCASVVGGGEGQAAGWRLVQLPTLRCMSRQSQEPRKKKARGSGYFGADNRLREVGRRQLSALVSEPNPRTPPHPMGITLRNRVAKRTCRRTLHQCRGGR